jgi:hypothetical protein
MPWVRFEATISAFERAKTVHALERAATVIGGIRNQSHKNHIKIERAKSIERGENVGTPCSFVNILCLDSVCAIHANSLEHGAVTSSTNFIEKGPSAKFLN